MMITMMAMVMMIMIIEERLKLRALLVLSFALVFPWCDLIDQRHRACVESALVSKKQTNQPFIAMTHVSVQVPPCC